jgi:biopolymer transport protein ExbD
MESHAASDSAVMADINVTPLVDVMLVLLIIFMIVTPAIVAGFQAKLPEGVNLIESPEDDARTTLGIDADGNYYLNKRPIARQQAEDLLRSEFNRHPLDKVLFLRAHRELEYGVLMEAMNTAKQAGARVVAAVTEQTPGTTSAVSTSGRAETTQPTQGGSN